MTSRVRCHNAGQDTGGKESNSMSAKIKYTNEHCGTLDDDPGARPGFHAYVASKAAWVTICDELPQFPEARA
jgi:hypothetical protein